ncbi:DLW-39 family protein [Brachybacterium sp. ACRRE]|nr:DLW-39 family protein [Brachybacterium sp. ACRRE]MCG7308085.1 DLW-39 family protein [Brachybacterium sp. ACRRE]
MKKLLTYSAVLVSSAVAGVLVWRKVESDKLENDLWAEAEKISEQQPKA